MRIIKSMEEKYLLPSLDLIEAVFTDYENPGDAKITRNLAAEYGYKACIVEGNPMNYRSRGFKTSAPYGITAHASIGLPAIDCMMVRELVPGGLEGIQGQVCYDDYESLH